MALTCSQLPQFELAYCGSLTMAPIKAEYA